MEDTRSRILSRAYWEVVIRPVHFARDKIANITQLYPIIEKIAVHLRGWPYPVVLNRFVPAIKNDSIEIEYFGSPWPEWWSFYQSGQFVDYSGLHYDWLELSDWRTSHEPPDPRAILGIGDAVFRFTEIWEFAARLAMSEAGQDRMALSIALRGIQGRALWVDSASRAPMMGEYVTQMEVFERTLELDRDDLVATSRERALQLALELFRRFGWDPPMEVLRSQQSELLRR